MGGEVWLVQPGRTGPARFQMSVQKCEDLPPTAFVLQLITPALFNKEQACTEWKNGSVLHTG